MSKILNAAKDWGWVLALAIALAALTFSWLASFNPVEEAADHVAEPALMAAGVLSGTCPGGWEDVSARNEHVRVRSCERAGWLVILTPEGDFDHGLQLDTPGAQIIEDSKEVPGWPR